MSRQIRTWYLPLLALLCAALLAGCTGLGFGPAAGGQAQSAGSSAAALLEDGALRAFACPDGSVRIYHGSALRWQGRASDSVYLLIDQHSGQAAHYVVECNDPASPGQRLTTVYDAAGSAVWSAPGNWALYQAGNWLLGTPAEAWGGEVVPTGGDALLLDLATGAQRTFAGMSGTLSADGAGHTLISLAPALDTGAAQGYEQWQYGIAVSVLDGAGNLTATQEHCSVNNVWDPFGSDALTGWVELSRYTPSWEAEDGEGYYTSCLYCPATGALLEGFVSVCGPGLVCLGNNGQGYRVVDLATGSQLAAGSWRFSFYCPAFAVCWGYYGGGYGSLLCLSNSEVESLRSFSQDQNGMSMVRQDGTLQLYSTDGTLLGELAPEATGLVQAGDLYITNCSGPLAMVTVYAEDYTEERTMLCSPGGLLLDTAAAGYGEVTSFQYLTTCQAGPLFAAYYAGPGGATLCRVVDAQGNTLLDGLGYAYRSISLPDGCFEARQGFACGWMDWQGRWLCSAELFQSIGEEDGGYIW